MRKMHLVLLTLLLLLNTFGCAGQTNIPVENVIFTDVFFTDVVEIRDSRFGQVSGERMEPVIQYLKHLTLTATDEHLSAVNENGEQLYGLDLITFRYGDGTEITILRNHAKMSGLGEYSYVVEDGNLNSGLKEAFDQALNQGDG